MVTCRLSHRIEALGNDGVGSSVGVNVGSGICVAVGVAEMSDPLCVAQAVRKTNPMSKTLDNLLKLNMVNSIIY
jgi:hypothetical protein